MKNISMKMIMQKRIERIRHIKMKNGIILIMKRYRINQILIITIKIIIIIIKIIIIIIIIIIKIIIIIIKNYAMGQD